MSPAAVGSDMQNQPDTFWGKLERDESGRVTHWHPLIDHCADVAAVTEALLRLPLWRARLSRLAGRTLTDLDVARLCVLAALHDIGKLNIGFQAKGLDGFGPPAGHVKEAVAALCKPALSPLGELAVWGNGVTALLIAALCHHGRPYAFDSTSVLAVWQDSLWRPQAGFNPQAGLKDLLAQCRRWFPDAYEPQDATLPESLAFVHAFAGVVMLADWIGSNKAFFPYSELGDADRMTLARHGADAVLKGMEIDIALDARTDASGRSPFARVAPAGYSPRPAQAATLTLPREATGSIAILEAETGSGKTEAAFAHFAALFEAGLVDGFYFALPTRSAATQIHGRARDAMREAFAAPPPVVLAVPGYLRVDDLEGQKLPQFDVHWTDNPSERLRYRTWAAENAKRFLAAAISIGTVDQVLLSSLRVGHAHLRATTLLRHLLIVDEVHASDAYMGRILEDVLARHRAAGGHALLLSATLGAETRARLLHPGRTLPTLEEAERTPYPLLSYSGADERTIEITPEENHVTHLSAKPWLEDVDAVAKAAFADALRGAKVLVIRNTVASCIETQQAIEHEATAQGRRDLLFTCMGVPAPHHSRFSREDRTQLDTALEERFGRVRPGGGCVIVATQTVQQSLDIDCDVLLTDLCPADVLLQRLGRLQRHRRHRPNGFEDRRAYVLVPAQRDLSILIRADGSARNHYGLGSVYEDLRILEATWRLLETYPAWRLPAMNRFFVEHSLHTEALAVIVSELGGRWPVHAMQVRGAQRGESRQAELNLVNWSVSYAEMSFPDGVEQWIPTRLGESDRRVCFETPVTSPFNHSIDELTIRASQARGIPPEETSAERVVVSHGAVTFTFGRKRFTYDRLGLRLEATPPKEVEEDDGP